MDNNTYEVVVKTLVEKINNLNTELYLKDFRIEELEKELAEAKKVADHGSN